MHGKYNLGLESLVVFFRTLMHELNILTASSYPFMLIAKYFFSVIRSSGMG